MTLGDWVLLCFCWVVLLVPIGQPASLPQTPWRFFLCRSNPGPVGSLVLREWGKAHDPRHWQEQTANEGVFRHRIMRPAILSLWAFSNPQYRLVGVFKENPNSGCSTTRATLVGGVNCFVIRPPIID